jgi:malonyl-CoA O-methyltransferase
MASSMSSDGLPPLLDPITAYALWAASYPPRAHNPVMRAEQRAMLSLLPADLRGRTILDVGCGTGRYMLETLRRGATRVVGLDLSPQMLRRARTELENARRTTALSPPLASPTTPDIGFIQASLEALPVRDGWADLTICGLTIGHLPVLETSLAELQRATRSEGTIVCSDFHPLAHARGWRREFSADGQRYAVHHTPHRSDDWQRACAALGLHIVRTLEPRLDLADIHGHSHPDPAALEVPVALVLELRGGS